MPTAVIRKKARDHGYEVVSTMTGAVVHTALLPSMARRWCESREYAVVERQEDR